MIYGIYKKKGTILGIRKEEEDVVLLLVKQYTEQIINRDQGLSHLAMNGGSKY